VFLAVDCGIRCEGAFASDADPGRFFAAVFLFLVLFVGFQVFLAVIFGVGGEGVAAFYAESGFSVAVGSFPAVFVVGIQVFPAVFVGGRGEGVAAFGAGFGFRWWLCFVCQPFFYFFRACLAVRVFRVVECASASAALRCLRWILLAFQPSLYLVRACLAVRAFRVGECALASAALRLFFFGAFFLGWPFCVLDVYFWFFGGVPGFFCGSLLPVFFGAFFASGSVCQCGPFVASGANALFFG
jgi:hypothetical protein